MTDIMEAGFRQEKFRKVRREFVMVAIILTFLGISGFQLYKVLGPNITRVFADMETVNRTENGLFFAGKELVSNGESQSSDEAFRGRFAARILPHQRFSLNFASGNLNGNEKISLSVWRKIIKPGKGLPEFVITAGEHWTSVKKGKSTNPEGWEHLVLTTNLPPETRGKELKIYCWNPGEGEFFVDDLEIVIRN